MTLANMISIDKSALLCDLAETYHIYDIKALPLHKVALFSVGLRGNSRIKMRMADIKYSFEELMMMTIVDHLAVLVWSKTKKGTKKPKSLMATLLDIDHENNISSFSSSDEFEKARKEILMKEG